MPIQAKTLLLELPEEFWNLATIFTEVEHLHEYLTGPGTLSKTIEIAIQTGLIAHFVALTSIAPDVATDVETAIKTKKLTQAYIHDCLRKGETNEYKP